jgi:hypothetical protein
MQSNKRYYLNKRIDRMTTYLRYGLCGLLALLLMTGCRKDEFIPPPEGEKVPYEDPGYKTLEETLKASPYQLFLKAYQRSHMDSVLKGNYEYTLLAPTDAAMQAAGYTEAVIAAMPENAADELVAFLTLRGKISKEALGLKPGNLGAVSLLSRMDLHVLPFYYGDGTPSSNYDKYYYRNYMAVSGGKLLINGMAAGDVQHALPASNGYIWAVDVVLPKPVDKSFWDVLAADPRFTMFMEIQRKADSTYDIRYRKAVEEAIGYDPGGFGWVDAKRTNYEPKFDLIPDWNGTTMMEFNMVFAPTNDAFHQAGFQTVEDVMAWNDKYATSPVFDWNTYEVFPFGFPSDSVLAYHWDFGRDNLQYGGTYGKSAGPTATVFYANDLNNAYLGDYPVNQLPNILNYIMPFSFGKSGDGKPTVQIKGSDAPPATIVETINTIMGPLHVVDRLLIPKNLKMN